MLGESWRHESYKYRGGGNLPSSLSFLPILLPHLDPSWMNLSAPFSLLSHPHPRLPPLRSFAICLPSWLPLRLRSGNTRVWPQARWGLHRDPPKFPHPTPAFRAGTLGL